MWVRLPNDGALWLNPKGTPLVQELAGDADWFPVSLTEAIALRSVNMGECRCFSTHAAGIS